MCEDKTEQLGREIWFYPLNSSQPSFSKTDRTTNSKIVLLSGKIVIYEYCNVCPVVTTNHIIPKDNYGRLIIIYQANVINLVHDNQMKGKKWTEQHKE